MDVHRRGGWATGKNVSAIDKMLYMGHSGATFH